MQKKHSGFTLIEILVVVAIIGILTSVVVLSVNSTRNRAANSLVAQVVTDMRAEAEIHYSKNNNNYSGLCNVGNDFHRFADRLILENNSITNKSVTLSDDQDNSTIICHVAANGFSYAVSAPLINTGNGQKYSCVDSSGWAGVVSSALVSGDTDCH